jgi:hypothetical protein
LNLPLREKFIQELEAKAMKKCLLLGSNVNSEGSGSGPGSAMIKLSFEAPKKPSRKDLELEIDDCEFNIELYKREL